MLVLQLGLDSAYVLDEMKMYEIRALMKYSHYKNMDSWSQSRMIAYIVAQSNSTKKMKPSDIMEFPWEKVQENASNEEIAVSKEEIESLKDKAKQFEKLLNDK
jgi:hypothetical protein